MQENMQNLIFFLSAGMLPMEPKRELTAKQNKLEQDLAALRAACLEYKKICSLAMRIDRILNKFRGIKS